MLLLGCRVIDDLGLAFELGDAPEALPDVTYTPFVWGEMKENEASTLLMLHMGEGGC